MSTCPNEEFCCAFVDDEVSELSKKEFEEHLSKCERCKQVINRYRLLRASLVYDEVPELNLDQSFEKLLLKRNSIKKRPYRFFSTNMKYKIIAASTVAGIFLFGFLFVLLQHNSSYDKTYILHKGEVKFTPIVPMSYRQHHNIIPNIDLHDMTNIIKTDKKYNKKIYKNFTNTFNNFSSLYVSLENNTNDFSTILPNINENVPYNYRASMPIYADLNKYAK